MYFSHRFLSSHMKIGTLISLRCSSKNQGKNSLSYLKMQVGQCGAAIFDEVHAHIFRNTMTNTLLWWSIMSFFHLIFFFIGDYSGSVPFVPEMRTYGEPFCLIYSCIDLTENTHQNKILLQ